MYIGERRVNILKVFFSICVVRIFLCMIVLFRVEREMGDLGISF